jgi:hypothetical protein
MLRAALTFTRCARERVRQKRPSGLYVLEIDRPKSMSPVRACAGDLTSMAGLTACRGKDRHYPNLSAPTIEQAKLTAEAYSRKIFIGQPQFIKRHLRLVVASHMLAIHGEAGFARATLCVRTISKRACSSARSNRRIHFQHEQQFGWVDKQEIAQTNTQLRCSRVHACVGGAEWGYEMKKCSV